MNGLRHVASDGGAGAVLALGVLAAAVAAALGLVGGVGLALEGARAQVAADAAALSGAIELRHGRARGSPDPAAACAAAAEAANRAGAVLTRCDASEGSGQVSVTVDAGATRASVAGPRG